MLEKSNEKLKGRGRYRANSAGECNLDMLEERCLALEHPATKRKKVSALGQEESVASLVSVLQSHLRFNKLGLRLFDTYLSSHTWWQRLHL